MPTRQDKADAKARRHLDNIHAQDMSLPHSKKPTAADSEASKSLIAKHEARRREIEAIPNAITINTDPKAKCNHHKCLFKGEYTLIVEEHGIIILYFKIIKLQLGPSLLIGYIQEHDVAM